MASKYKSIAEIEAEFNAKLGAAEEADRPTVRAEMSEAKAEFYQGMAQAAQRTALISAQFVDHPELRDFPQLIVGETEEEIKASANEAAAKLGALRGPAVPDPALAARPNYGDPSAGIGGGTPIVHSDEAQKRERRIYAALNMGNKVNAADIAQWMPGRLREARKQARQNPSYGGYQEEPVTAR